MPSYLHPGVYVEEIPSGSKPIEAAGTSTACFIGNTAKGPLNNDTVIGSGDFEPVLISKWDVYDDQFGGIQSDVDGATGVGDPMGYSVCAFFRNGGSKAYIIRAGTGGDKSSGSNTADGMIFSAANEGEWGDRLIIKISPKPGSESSSVEFTVDVGTGVVVSGKLDEFIALESFSDVTLDSSSSGYIDGKINDGSGLVNVEVKEANVDATNTAILDLLPDDPVDPAAPVYEAIELGGGSDITDPVQDDYDAIFTALLKYRDVNIILLPGQFWPEGSSANEIIDSAVSHCETMKNRMVIIDPKPGLEFGNESDVNALSLPTSTYTALYYPWAKVSNPYYDADTNPGAAANVLVAPSAFAAGMWSKIDGKRGVWKAPAGVGTALLGVSGFEYTIEDAEQDYLNPVGVNCLRTLPNYGRVIWGSRTLSTKTDPEWRYIPVRRTAMLIEESVFNGIQWAVFEPNNHLLWSSLRSNISSFMSGMFRAGAFQGEKASDAYFVRCGLGDTMTQGDIDRGQVIVIVGFAPLKPAEFVIVRIQQIVGETS